MDDDRNSGSSFPPANDPDPAGGDGFDPPPPPPRPEVGGLPPWEDRRHHGILGGFFTTVAQVMTAPGRFFQDQPVDRGWLGPVSFAVIMGVLAALVGWMWTSVFSGMEVGLLAMMEELGEDSLANTAMAQMLETAGVILSPFTTLVFLFVYAGVFHLGILLFHSGGRGFEATLRAVAYGNAAYVLAFVPMCGGLLTTVWSLVIYVIALHKLHGCSLGRAAVIVIAPMVAFACGCGSLLGLLGLMAA